MLSDIKEILITKEALESRVIELGASITRDYLDKKPLILGVLKGSFIFMADLCRHIDTPCETAFITASSYSRKATITSGSVSAREEGRVNVTGRHVIIVEDILDTGITLDRITEMIGRQQPSSVKICVLLDKPARRKTKIKADYVGFEIPDEFIVGYGLDYDEKYRNLPYIGILKPSVYND